VCAPYGSKYPWVATSISRPVSRQSYAMRSATAAWAGLMVGWVSFLVAQAAGLSLSSTSGGQRISPLLKRPIGRCTQTVAVVVVLDDVALDAVQVAGDGGVVDATRSPTLSIASALAALTVCSSSWRVRTASAIAVRCRSSSPAAIWSRRRRSDSAAGSGGGMRAGRDACGWGWTWPRVRCRDRWLPSGSIRSGADGWSCRGARVQPIRSARARDRRRTAPAARYATRA
jgi:hypothetical protein